MIKKILIGSLVGIGSILPGVSGGMIAAAFNIYSKLIEALDLLTKHPIKAILSIWQYLIGILLGILAGFLLIAYVFYIIPLPSTLFFIGLILGALPEIYFLAKKDSKKLKNIIVTGVTILLMLGLTFFAPYLSQSDVQETNFIVWILVGFLLALSLIVPGLSGTMLLLIIGYYGPMILLGKGLLESVFAFNLEAFFTDIWSLLFIVIGLVVAFVVLGKLINYVLKAFPKIFYQIILGIIIASPINIIMSLKDELILEEPPINIFDINEQWLMWLIGMILIPVGMYLSRLFTKDKDETKENQTSNN